MKTISRRALAALVFGFVTLGAGSTFAQQAEKGPGCCTQQPSCSSACCTQKRPAAAYNETAERFRAKYGREYPLKRSTVQTSAVSESCCSSCC
jgi:hypothetical protein